MVVGIYVRTSIHRSHFIKLLFKSLFQRSQFTFCHHRFFPTGDYWPFSPHKTFLFTSRSLLRRFQCTFRNLRFFRFDTSTYKITFPYHNVCFIMHRFFHLYATYIKHSPYRTIKTFRPWRCASQWQPLYHVWNNEVYLFPWANVRPRAKAHKIISGW